MQCAIGNLQPVLSAKSVRTISKICGKENLASLVQEFRHETCHAIGLKVACRGGRAERMQCLAIASSAEAWEVTRGDVLRIITR